MSTYHSHGSVPPRCDHRQRTVARNVTAVIAKGHLAGGERGKGTLHPLPYTLIEFCSNKGCERVFRAERVR